MKLAIRPAALVRARLLAGALVLGSLLAPPPVRAQANDLTSSHDAAIGDVPAPTGPAIAPEYFFYRPGQEFGSTSQFGPVSVVLNRGFSTIVWSEAERRPLHIDWGNGWTNVRESLTHPARVAESQGGVGEFLFGEFGPKGSVWQWAFATNLMGHVVGGGITYRALGEWYDAHGVPYPMVAGAASAMGVILINEMIVVQHLDEGSPSTWSDVYVFEPIGIALFSFDPVARFFARTLKAQDWSPQASIVLPTGELVNSSQVMAYRVPLPFIDRLDVLSVTGMGTQTGVIWDLDAEHSIGGGIGFQAKERVYDEAGREQLRARASGGLYLSRRTSLLASLNLYHGLDRRAALNVYPGVLGGPLRNVGLWTVLDRDGRVDLGITALALPGVGLGWGVNRQR